MSCWKFTMLMIVVPVTLFSCSASAASIDCNGLHPIYMEHMLMARGLILNDHLSSLKNRECYCVEIPDANIAGFCPYVCSPPMPPYRLSSRLIDNAPRFVCENHGEISHYVIRSCPDDFDDATNRTLCEEDLPIHNVTMATIEVVTDEVDGIPYYNRYCAECNQAKQIYTWKAMVLCESALYLIGAMNRDELWRLTLQKQSTCKITQEYGGSPAAVCLQMFHKEIVISCNVTGKEVFLTGFEEECNDSPGSWMELVTDNTFTFKNVFCIICNSELTSTRKSGHSCTSSDKLPHFYRFLFGHHEEGFGKDENENNYNKSRCRDNEWMDLQGDCREVICTKGKLLEMDQCKTALKQDISGLPYRLSLLLNAEAHIPAVKDNLRDTNVEDVASFAVQKIKAMLSKWSETIQIQVGVLLDRQVVKTPFNVSDSHNERKASSTQQTFMLPRYVWLKVFITAPTRRERDIVEQSYIDSFNKSSIMMHIDDYYSTSYRVQFVEESSYDFMSSCVGTPHSMLCGTIDRSYQKDSNGNLKLESDIYIYDPPKSDFLEIRPYLLCPYIEISNISVEETVNLFPVPHVEKIVIRFADFIFEFVEPIELYQITRGTENTFYICRELLNTNVPRQIQYPEVPSVFTTIQYYLTIICVSASLMCLLATVATYCLFPDLRCVAGCNTLGLSSSLMVAQLFLFIASDIQGPSPVCTAIGIITHYSWLVLFSWMFLCCLHVLRVFAGLRGNTRVSQRQENKEKIKNVVLSLMVPALIVVVIVVTYMLMYNGRQIGYGHTKCAMDSPYAINGPLIFVIACNTVFFIIVVSKIWMVRRLQKNTDVRNDDRKDFVVYIKLSTLTGMFWLMVILGEVFNNDVIRCLAIIANGCQGMFIFLSFVANRRVLGRYKAKFNTARPESGTANSFVQRSTK